MSQHRPVIVVGGGIGGLASALALAREGFDVRVLERAPAFSEVGAGIQLGPNMMRALSLLGLKDRVLASAWIPNRLVLRDALNGSEVTCVPAGAALLQRFGEPYALTHRADFLAILVDACHNEPRIELSTGSRVETMVDDGETVVVEVEGGETLEGSALIGADGLWSQVREQLIGDGPPRVSGHIAYRGVLPRAEVPEDLWSPDMTVWVGPRTHLVHYPLRGGELYNLVAVFHSDRYTEGYNEAGDPEELWSHFRGERPEVRRLLERIDAWKFWVLCDRDPRRGWSKGRTTLVGDAAHPMLQYLAQGAAMAVEDAICVTRELADANGDAAPAFERYEQQRVLRTGRAQVMARVYGEAFHADHVTADLRDEMLAGRTSDQSLESMAWLYDYQP